MSKKKNTLKDLDDFLKQQAATLVAPTSLREKIEAEPAKKADTTEPVQQSEPAGDRDITADTILHDLLHLADTEGEQFRDKFYSLIIHTLEQQKKSSPQDKMLINTALYLQHGEDWKDVIREYWAKK